MSWHDHPYTWKALARCRGFRGEPLECIDRLAAVLSRPSSQGQRLSDTIIQNTKAQFLSEFRWTEDSRPYYDVYPSVTEAFTKIDLNRITGSQVSLPIRDLLIRFPVGKEFQASPTMAVGSVLVAETNAKGGGKGILLSINHGVSEIINGVVVPIPTVRGVILTENSIEEQLEKGRARRESDLRQFRGNSESEPCDEEGIENVMRLVVSLCLLKDNPDLIEQEPLDSDRARWEATHDPSLLTKAERRGKRCWSVGKHIEVAPGFRRPHFAIRWCGKGGNDPQLRPIKGCLVRREKIEEVPTGYLD